MTPLKSTGKCESIKTDEGDVRREAEVLIHVMKITLLQLYSTRQLTLLVTKSVVAELECSALSSGAGLKVHI